VPLSASLHFTPDGVSRRRYVITINIALLTEGLRPQLKLPGFTRVSDDRK
jgi:hypothetical protein